MNPEWLSAAGTLTTGLAAAVGGWAALRGLGTWRSELVGRRKTELAEDVLAQFYRARDVLIWARTPAARQVGGAKGGGDGDGAAAPGAPHHALSAPIERITEESELFSELQAGRYRFIAHFGEAAAEPFEVIRAVQAEVIAAAGELMRDEGDPGADQEARRDAWEDAIWDEGKDDPIAARVNEAVRRIEQICLPLINEENRGAGPFRRRV